MYLKKAMTGVAAVGLMAALFCGCGTNHKQMQSEHAEEHLEQIIIGSDSYPPYNYLDENGNATGIDVELAQRIIDFTSGACYSLGGSLQQVSSYIFVLGPYNVDITGDLQNILGGSVPSVRVGY